MSAFITYKTLVISTSLIATIAAAPVAALAGDVTVRAGVIEVSLQKTPETGMTLKVDPARCGQAGCATFGIDWSVLSER
jgi:hypothetical protein